MKKFKQDLNMSDENNQILDQVTELITSKKEQIKDELIDDKKGLQKNKSQKNTKQSNDLIVILLIHLLKKNYKNG